MQKVKAISQIMDAKKRVQALATELREALQSVQARIMALEEERHTLMQSPIGKEDFKALMLSDIDARAQIFEGRVAEAMVIQPYERSGPFGSLSCNVGAAMSGSRGIHKTVNLLSVNDPHEVRDEVSGVRDALWFFLRDAMKTTVERLIDSMTTWPVTDAVPLAEAKARLQALDAELAGLREQEAELIASGVGGDKAAAVDFQDVLRERRASVAAAEAQREALEREEQERSAPRMMRHAMLPRGLG
ncbi:hypothetical protein [Paracidovorax anthurii]|uniref:Uncharacterized protein n=1 Tax=Paracidovorax anthurii TaxID=78229 RepID=A0A328YIY1_9BURK|nr:hypothetical protein [Paracidovorax anthurii]RAR74021.1 hypothetical protein AX018_106816 [Paracidovorax anthurii]